jgi:hypothetical protein
MGQGVGPEFKPQYRKQKRKEKATEVREVKQLA